MRKNISQSTVNCKLFSLNRRGVSDWIQNIVSLLLAGIGLLVLFMFVIAQFGILTGGNRSEDSARLAFKSFVLELDSATVNSEDHLIKRMVPYVTEPYLMVFFSGGVEGEAGSVFLESFSGELQLVLKKPLYCGESSCLCLYHGENKNRGWSELGEMYTEILSDWWADIPNELIECTPVKSDYVVTYTPPADSVNSMSLSLRQTRIPEYTQSVKSVGIPKTDIERSETIIGTNEKNSIIPSDEVSKELSESVKSERDESLRLFTSRNFYFYSSSVLMNKERRGFYYVEKMIHDGKIYLLVIPENTYTEERAKVFPGVYGDPVETLKNYISEGNKTQILLYGGKKFSQILDLYKNKKTNADMLESFSHEYLNYLKNSPTEKLSEDSSSPMFVEEGARIVRSLLENTDEDFARYETVSFFESVSKVKIGAKGVLEVLDTKKIDDVRTSKYELYLAGINNVNRVGSSEYSMLKTIVTDTRFWGTVLRGHDREVPQQIFQKLKSLSESSTGMEQQRAYYLLGLAYKNYDYRELLDEKQEITKRKYADAITTFKASESIDSTTDIAILARDEKNALCALEKESLGDDGVRACA